MGDVAYTEVYTLSLHVALPICGHLHRGLHLLVGERVVGAELLVRDGHGGRLNANHAGNVYADDRWKIEDRWAGRSGGELLLHGGRVPEDRWADDVAYHRGGDLR